MSAGYGRRGPLVVALVATVSVGSRLWEGDLFADQVLYGAIAQRIVERGEWLSLHFGDDPYWKKPPLVFWLVALANHLPLPPVMAARLFPALFGVGACVLLYLVVRRLFDDVVALAAGVVLATSPRFLRDASGLSLDPAVAFFTLAALLCWLRGLERDRLRDFGLAGLAWGLAVMSKGAFGILAPATCLVYVATQGRWALLWSRGVLVAVLVAAAVALPWHVHQVLTWGPDFLRVYFGQEVLDRVTGDLELDIRPVSYPLELLREDWPWLPFAAVGAVTAVRRARQNERAAVFVLAWPVLCFVLISLTSLRRAQYLFALYPPLALVEALGVASLLPDRWLTALPRTLAVAAGVAALALHALPLPRHRPRYDDLRALAPALDRLAPGHAALLGHRTSVQLRAASLLYLHRDVRRVRPEDAGRQGGLVLSESQLVEPLERAGLRPVQTSGRYVLYQMPAAGSPAG